MNGKTTSTQSGQALIEFLAGIVVMLAIFAFIVQLVSLSRADLEGMSEARRQAGRLALSPLIVLELPEYISTWEPGDDTRTYSRDDRHENASVGAFQSAFTEPITPGQAEATLMARVPNNRIRDLRETPRPVTQFGLISARVTEDVPLLPAVRHLLYDAPEIEVESKVWLTSTTGIY